METPAATSGCSYYYPVNERGGGTGRDVHRALMHLTAVHRRQAARTSRRTKPTTASSTKAREGISRAAYRQGSAPFTSGSLPRAHFHGDSRAQGVEGTAQGEQCRDQVAAYSHRDTHGHDERRSRQPAGDRQRERAEEEREEPAEHHRRDDQHRIDLQAGHGVADELDEEDEHRHDGQPHEQRGRTAEEQGSAGDRLTEIGLHPAGVLLRGGQAVRRGHGGDRQEKRDDELVQVAPEEPGGRAEAGQPERIDDPGWQLVDGIADAGGSAERRPEGDGDRHERPEPDPPAKERPSHRSKRTQDEFDVGSVHERSPYRSRNASSRSGSSTMRLATRMPGEHREDRIDRTRQGRREPSSLDHQVLEPRDGVKLRAGDVFREPDLDPLSGSTAKLLDGPLDHDPPGSQDGDAVGRPLDLAQDVRGEKHRGPAVACLGDHGQELVLHQRIEPAGRLVEDQEVGPWRERQEQGDLSSVARREVAGGPIEIDLQALGDRVHARHVQAPSEPADRCDELARGHPFGKSQLARDVTDSTSHADPVTAWIPPEYLDRSARRPDEVEQAADGRALAGAVRPDEAKDLAPPNLQVDAADCLDEAEVLDQAGQADGGVRLPRTAGDRSRSPQSLRSSGLGDPGDRGVPFREREVPELARDHPAECRRQVGDPTEVADDRRPLPRPGVGDEARRPPSSRRASSPRSGHRGRGQAARRRPPRRARSRAAGRPRSRPPRPSPRPRNR